MMNLDDAAFVMIRLKNVSLVDVVDVVLFFIVKNISNQINSEEKEWNPKRSMCSKNLTEKFWKEIDKCQLLCYDCHKEKTKKSLRKSGV